MNAVAEFQAPRLPFHPSIEERFGVDRASWKALTEAVFPNAKTTDSVVMVLSYCRARKLDPFKRPAHIVPMWDSAKGGYVETVWPGIAELRTTAFRTGQYAGIDETEFGPDTTRTFKGEVGTRGRRETVEITVTFPQWCRITVYRVIGGQRAAFHSPKVYWAETYGRRGGSEIPNEMWAKRPFGQIEKCAEAAGLRRAFPEEIGNELTAEEMEGQRITAAEAPVPVPPAPPAAQALPVEPPLPPAQVEPPKPPVPVGYPTYAANPDKYHDFIDAKFGEAGDMDALNELYARYVEPEYSEMFPPDQSVCGELFGRHQKRIKAAND